jgi:hypothetical protein
MSLHVPFVVNNEFVVGDNYYKSFHVAFQVGRALGSLFHTSILISTTSAHEIISNPGAHESSHEDRLYRLVPFCSCICTTSEISR